MSGRQLFISDRPTNGEFTHPISFLKLLLMRTLRVLKFISLQASGQTGRLVPATESDVELLDRHRRTEGGGGTVLRPTPFWDSFLKGEFTNF